jgi:hypothetical protein
MTPMMAGADDRNSDRHAIALCKSNAHVRNGSMLDALKSAGQKDVPPSDIGLRRGG